MVTVKCVLQDAGSSSAALLRTEFTLEDWHFSDVGGKSVAGSLQARIPNGITASPRAEWPMAADHMGRRL